MTYLSKTTTHTIGRSRTDGGPNFTCQADLYASTITRTINLCALYLIALGREKTKRNIMSAS